MTGRAPVRAQAALEAWETACAAAATLDARAAVWREREARWRAICDGLSPQAGVAALLAAGEISADHAAMLNRAMEGR